MAASAEAMTNDGGGGVVATLASLPTEENDQGGVVQEHQAPPKIIGPNARGWPLAPSGLANHPHAAAHESPAWIWVTRMTGLGML